MPAEWEPHRATWIAWPHHEPDWPGKLPVIPWVYAEIVRVLADHERVEILCHSSEVMQTARVALDAHGVRHERVAFHEVPTDRVRLGPNRGHRLRRRCCPAQLGVQCMGEVPKLASRRRSGRRNGTADGTRPGGTDAIGFR